MIAIVGILAAILLPALSRARESARRSSCANKMKQIGYAFKMYANENQGYFPRTSMHLKSQEIDCGASTPFLFVPSAKSNDDIAEWHPSFNVEDVYPEYLSDYEALICPSNASFNSDNLENPASDIIDVPYQCDSYCRGWRLARNSYTYFGYALDKIGEQDSSFTYQDMANFSGFYYRVTLPALVFNFSPIEPSIDTVTLNAQSFALASTYLDSINKFVPVDVPMDMASCGIHLGADNIEWDAQQFGLSWGEDWGIKNSGHLGTGNSDTMERLREGIEQFLITDINNPASSSTSSSDLVVLFDNVGLKPTRFNHLPKKANILFLDGHVEFAQEGKSDILSTPFLGTMEVIQRFYSTLDYFDYNNGVDADECPNGF